MNAKILSILFLVSSLTLCGCESQMPSKKSDSSANMSTQASKITQSSEKPIASEPTIAGKVKETMNSAGYTYVLLEKDGVQTWAALPETQVAVGQEITIYAGMEMKNFKSNTLNRTFDSIIFSSGIVGAAANKDIQPSGKIDTQPTAIPRTSSPTAAMVESQKMEKTPEQMALEAHSTVKRMDPLKFLGEKIDKAPGENSYIIADLHAKAKELAGKTVQVRGKVTKVSTGIMGKNWVHMQDGSGAQDAQNFDITITTQAQPKEGDVVIFEGVLAADKDFGAGYRYDVIIEDAKLK